MTISEIGFFVSLFGLFFLALRMCWRERSGSSQNNISAEIVYGRKALRAGKYSVATLKQQNWFQQEREERHGHPRGSGFHCRECNPFCGCESKGLPVSSRQEQTVLSRVLNSRSTQQVGREGIREKEESVTRWLQDTYRTAYPMDCGPFPVSKQTPETMHINQWFEEQCKRLLTLVVKGFLDREQFDIEYSRLVDQKSRMLYARR